MNTVHIGLVWAIEGQKLTALAMLMQADCPNLFDTDQSDSDFKMWSGDNIYTESESSSPTSVFPPTPARSKSMTVVEENLNDERKLVQENNKVKRDGNEADAGDEGEEEEDEGLDDKDEDESEGLQHHTDEAAADDASGGVEGPDSEFILQRKTQRIQTPTS